MATALLAGANPVAGLYSSAMGPLVGGMVTSTGIMVIATTSAAALGTAEALDGIPADEIDSLLGTLVLLVGVFALLAGLLRMGRYTRFVSHSVMTGFLTGGSLILILSQFGDFVGYPATGANSVAKAWDTLTHIPEWSMPALAIGASAMLIALVLDRTPLSVIGPLLAIVVPSVVVAMRPQAEVAVASDTAEIPAGMPMPALPSFDYVTSTTITSALAIVVVILVQSAGVAGQFRNPDGVPSSISRDFVAHGAANIAVSLFRGIPVGGSVGQTAFNVLAGGVGRLSVITSGAWMILFLVALSGVVGQVAMPTLAALLILAGFQSLKPREVRAVSRTTRSGAVLMTLTLVATLFLPVTVAVGLGVILSALHTLNRSMNEVRVFTLVEVEGRGTALRPAPETLAPAEVTVLDIEGNLFYAGARSLEGVLPRVLPGSRPVVVLRLRGRDRIGSTLLKVLEWYAGQIRDAGGRLYLSGVDPRVADQIQRSGLIGPEDLTVVEASEILGESTLTAMRAGTTWLRGGTSPDA
jgi:SulP family sulfate permease